MFTCKRNPNGVGENQVMKYIYAVIVSIFLPMSCWCQDLVKAVNTEHSTSFVVQPKDANHNYPMLFGGVSLAEMDRCAGITTRRLLYHSPTGAKDAVTVAIKDVKFLKGGEVKDLIFITGKVIKLGEKSVTIKMVVERETKEGRVTLIEAEYVFVSYDLEKKEAIPHGLILETK